MVFDLQLPVQSVYITTRVRIPLMARCSRYYIMWQKSLVLSGYSGFLTPTKLTANI